MVSALGPDQPVACFRPHTLKRSAQWFTRNFPGKVLYAVKANPSPFVLRELYANGIRHFDVASIGEVELMAKLCPQARKYFMHPVKSRKAITRAYAEYGISDFAFDSMEELEKILDCTGHAADLNLFLRIRVRNGKSRLPLIGKFGANYRESIRLLRAARPHVQKLGICFHVGSQCMSPDAYSDALDLVARMVAQSKVQVDVIDAGGGFPSRYPALEPPPIDEFLGAIRGGFARIPGHEKMELWCEPGRALVAECMSVVAQVELRKGDCLYLNDGTYGSLFDAGGPKFIFPAKLVRQDGEPVSEGLRPYRFYGPTCDSIDYMPGPFMMPDDIREGDYVEIGLLGAYGSAMRTQFNGFYSDETVVVADEPMTTMYPQTKLKTADAA